MSQFWNERYSQVEYVYGETPNVFFAAQLDKLSAGAIILPCEGEGRNAVYAASQGWDVKAFDTSEEGQKKALLLAGKKNVLFEYTVEDALAISYPANSADAVAFIFAHFPPAVRTLIHQKAMGWLKPGGTLILEAFNPAQLNNQSGGPKEPEMLYTAAMLNEDFKGLDIVLLHNVQTIISEGKYHAGIADTIQLVATKKQLAGKIPNP